MERWNFNLDRALSVVAVVIVVVAVSIVVVLQSLAKDETKILSP